MSRLDPDETLVFTPPQGRVDGPRPGRADAATDDGDAGGPDAPGGPVDGTAGRAGGRRFGRRKGRGRGREDVMVPDAQFSSYYGRQIVKPAPWKHEIPAYLYLGGLAAGSAMLAAGAELSGRDTLRRNTRYTAVAALAGSMGALVADLGKPSRFLNMMRTVKLTSPMSVGTWILTGYGAFTGGAFACEVARAVLPTTGALGRVAAVARFVDRPMALGSAAFAPPLAAYTAVLLADTATPTWHGAYRELPFVFVGSALLAAGGFAMVTTPTQEAAPARRVALLGGAMEFVAHHLMEKRLGMLAEPLHEGRPGRFGRVSQAAALGGLAVTAAFGRNRPAAVAAGIALNAASALIRFAVFEAGIASAKDPRYTVEPQRARLAARRAAGSDPHGITTG